MESSPFVLCNTETWPSHLLKHLLLSSAPRPSKLLAYLMTILLAGDVYLNPGPDTLDNGLLLSSDSLLNQDDLFTWGFSSDAAIT